MKPKPYRILTLLIIALCVGCSDKKEKPIGKPAVVVSKETKRTKPAFDTLVTNEFYHNELSNHFDIKVLVHRYQSKEPYFDSCVAKFTLLDKASKKVIDTFGINSRLYFGVFEDKEEVRSYSTKFNANKPIADNIFGDIVIADLNFDKKEDIAIINDHGGTGGPFYNFYLQNDKGKFVLNRFLTDSMVYFPDKIKNHELTTTVLGGMCFIGKHVYTFDTKTQTWWQKSHTTIDVCQNKVVDKTVYKH